MIYLLLKINERENEMDSYYFNLALGMSVSEAQRLRDKPKDDPYYDYEFSLDEANREELRSFESELASAINARGIV